MAMLALCLFSIIPAQAQVPAAPTGLTATAGNGQVSLTWNASSGATTYNVYTTTTSGAELSGTVVTGITATSYTITRLTNSTKYYFEVAAVNASGTSPLSAEVNATPILPAPTGVSATGGTLSVSVAWTLVPNAAAYNIYRSTTSGGEGTTAIATGLTASPYSDPSLSAGTHYFYTVAGTNRSVTSAQSAEANAWTLCAAPSAPTATPGSGQVALSWAAVTGATSYTVYRSTTSGGSYTPVNTGSATSFTDTGLTNSTTYFYVISATDPAGEGPKSAETSATPTGGSLPTVTGFSPTSGAIGAPVTVSGTNFTGATAVKFNGTTATFSVTNATTISTSVPSGATTGTISVTTPSGTATSSASFNVIPAPTITSFTPTSGAPGTSVTITGTNFTGATAVSFNGTAATYTVANASTITATIPTGATTGTISVTTSAGTAVSASPFTVSSAPTVTSFSPTSGAVGAMVTITGTNFTGATAIAFNRTSTTTFTVVSATQITVPVPAGASSGLIKVTTPAGSGTSAGTFTVLPAPTITSFTPTSGKPGDTVTVTGTNFTGTTAVKFNGLTATFSVGSATSITTTVPSGATTGPISVTNAGVTVASASSFTIVPAPTITSFTPTTGPVGTSVSITGTNFAGATEVKFNGTAAFSFTVASATSITAVVAAGTTTGPITVTTLGGTATSATPFTVPGSYAGDVPAPGWAEGSIPHTGGDSAGAGPASSMGVSIPSAVEENNPGTDLWSYNPVGLGVAFDRSYRSALVGASNYGSPGLSPGWTHGYDVVIDAATPGTWGALTVRYDNGALETLTPTLSAGAPTGAFAHPSGIPYIVTGTPAGTTGQWTSVTILSGDRSKMVFQPNPNASPANANHYVLAKIINLVGHANTFTYDAGNRLTTITNDAGTPATLLALAYDGSNHLQTVTDYDGSGTAQRQVTFTFDANGNLWKASTIADLVAGTTSITQWQYGYTSIAGHWYLTQVQSPDPATPATPSTLTMATVQYDASAHVQKHVDGNARETRFGYTNPNQAAIGYYPTAAASTPDLGWSQNYDGSTNVDLGILDANGKSSVVSYTGSPNAYLPTGVTTPNNEQNKVTLDSYGNVTDSWNVGRQIRSHMMFTDPGDLPMGQLHSSQVINDQFGDNLAATTFDYYGTIDGVYNGLLKSVTAPQPGASSHTATVQTMLSYTGSSSSSLGNLSTVVAPGPNSTAGNSTTYNTITYGYGNFTVGSLTYTKTETIGEPTSITVTGPNPSGVTPATRTEKSYAEYDLRGRRISSIDGLGNKTDYEYNAADQVTRVWFPSDANGVNHGAHTDYDYPYPGGPLYRIRLYSESDPTETGAAFRQVVDTYGHEGELLQVTGDVEPVSYSYDSAYRRTGITYYQPGGASFTTHYDYFPVGSLKAVRYPGNTGGVSDQISYTYDDDQNLATQTDGNGIVTTYVHDVGIDSRLNRIDYSDPSTSSVSLGYDHFNRTVSASNSVAAKTFTLDDLSNMLTQSVSFTAGPQNQQFTYDYFPDGSRKTMTTPLVVASQNTVQYQYYATGQLYQTQFPWPNGVWQHKYGSNGWLSRTSGPTVGSNVDLVDTNYTYTGRGLLRTLGNLGAENDPFNAGPVSNNVSTFSGTVGGGSMVYDAAGNRQATFANIPPVQWIDTSVNTHRLTNDASHLINYGYTSSFAKDTLTGEASAVAGSGAAGYSDVYTNSFSYDQSSNLTSFQWLGNTFAPAYNGDNQYTAASSFTYDGNGNPTAYLSTSANFAYDAENRLKSIGSTFSATYGPDDLRATKTAGGVTTYFLYDGDKPLIEETWNGTTPTFTAFYGRVADGMRALYKPTEGQFYAYLYDPQGNLVSRHFVQAYSNHASIQDINLYEAYGSNRQRINVYGSVPLDSVGFGGQHGNYTDNETGLVLMTHRYYDAGKGRFVTRDPIGYRGGINLYGYAGGNPVNRTDPSGHDGTDDMLDSMDANGGRNPMYAPLMKSIHKGAAAASQGAQFAAEMVPGTDYAEVITGRDMGYGRVPTWQRVLMAVPILGSVIHRSHAVQIARITRRLTRLARLRVWSNDFHCWGYVSFDAFKEVYGGAGTGFAWHHVIPQELTSKFGTATINNPKNLMWLPDQAGEIHRRITGFFNSKQPQITGSDTLLVWQWVRDTMNFEQAKDFGAWVVNEAARGHI